MPKPVIPIESPYTPELLPAVRYAVEGFLANGGKVFEFGSGYSTVWFARFADEVIAVEDDEEWYEELEKALKRSKRKAEVHLVPTEKMAEVINDYEEFDLVLVDCADSQRIPALKAARDHVKSGGWLLLDDSHWNMTANLQDLLNGWQLTIVKGLHKRHWKEHGEIKDHQTSIYTKP